MNILVMGFLYFPDITAKVDVILSAERSGIGQAFVYIFVPGTLPLFYLIAMLAAAAIVMFWAVKIATGFNIETIISEMFGAKKPKEAKSE
jgi:hypothetical protein